MTKRILGTAVLGSLGVAAGLVGVFYRLFIVSKGYTWLYPWIEPAGLLCVILAAVWIFVLWVPLEKGQKLLTFLLITMIVQAGFSWWMNRIPEQVRIEKSPGESHTVVIVENKLKQSRSIARVYHRFWKKEKERLPFGLYPMLKMQWLQEDVCAITATDKDGNTQQYAATFGDRGDGISYLDPLTAMDGKWAAPNSDVKLQVGSTVELRIGSQLYFYDSSECERYGTIAVTLGKGTAAEWTLLMNQDCHLVNNRVAAGGTLTLCPVKGAQPVPIVLECQEERDVWNGQEQSQAEEESILKRMLRKFNRAKQENEWERQQTERYIFNEMRTLAENNPSGEGYAPKQDGIFFVPATDAELSWDLRNILKEYQKCYRGSGMDYWAQIDQIRCLAGDENEGAYEIVTTQILGVSDVNGQVASAEKGEQRFTFRLLKTEQGYYVYPCHWDTDAGWHLEKKTEDGMILSGKSEYQFFLRGKSEIEETPDSFTKSPEEGLGELYREWLQEAYPSAAELIYEGTPGMELNEEGLYLLYDGITEDNLHYRYRVVKTEDNELRTDTKLFTLTAYQVAIKRSMSNLAEVEMPVSVEHENAADEKNTDEGESSTVDGSSDGKMAVQSGSKPRANEKIWLNQIEHFEKEVRLEDAGITFRMIVLDAAVGNRLYGLLKSYDDGKRWYFVAADAEAKDRLFGGGIDFTFFNEDYGFAVVAENGGCRAELWMTEDGGAHYSRAELEEHFEALPNGEQFQPYDFPKLPYEEDGVLYLLCGQGADGDFDGGDRWTLARYKSEDGGKHFMFDEIVPGTGE